MCGTFSLCCYATVPVEDWRARTDQQLAAGWQLWRGRNGGGGRSGPAHSRIEAAGKAIHPHPSWLSLVAVQSRPWIVRGHSLHCAHDCTVLAPNPSQQDVWPLQGDKGRLATAACRAQRRAAACMWPRTCCWLVHMPCCATGHGGMPSFPRTACVSVTVLLVCKGHVCL